MFSDYIASPISQDMLSLSFNEGKRQNNYDLLPEKPSNLRKRSEAFPNIFGESHEERFLESLGQVNLALRSDTHSLAC